MATLPRSRFRLPALAAAAILAAATAPRAGNHAAYPLPEERGTAGILGALEKLPIRARVLHVTAHPDDESQATLTWLARGAHVRTALFALTRGDGGQNVLGEEKYEALGLLRTGELLEACRVYGVETYFGTAYDFGFSKSAGETLGKWGHDALLGELVRFIRSWRPTIVISKWSGTDRDGHGHHQAAGRLTLEAYRAAADPARFPEQLREGLAPWQARKLYGDNVRGDAAPDTGGSPAWTVRVDVGAHDPVLGRSYREIGAEGYSKHRTQGEGARFVPPGRGYDYYRLVDSTAGTRGREASLLDGIDTSLGSILELAGPERAGAAFLAGELAAAERAARDALAAFTPRRPEASAEAAARGAAILADLVRRVEGASLSEPVKAALEDALVEKHDQFQAAVTAALGVYLVAGVEQPAVVPGDEVPVTVWFHDRGSQAVDLRRVTLWTPEGWVASLPGGAPLGPVPAGESRTFAHRVTVPAGAPVTEPFWFREGPTAARYRTRPTRSRFAPFEDPLVRARATYRYAGAEISVEEPVRARIDDPLRGVDFRDLQVMPPLAVAVSPELAVVPAAAEPRRREFRVSLESQAGAAQSGQVRLEAPSGWHVEPERADFRIARRGEAVALPFRVTIPPGATGDFTLAAVATAGGREYRRSQRLISRPENWTRYLYGPAAAAVKVFPVEVAAGLVVGYVPGAGDEVAPALENLGVRVRMLSADDLAGADLAGFAAIVTGVRAYNVNAALQAHYRRLLDYVERGGTLIVQYNRPGGGDGGAFPYGPYPAAIASGDRITDEASPVEMLDPGHAVWTRPNRITPADFDGWVQERGLYFLRRWDPGYRPLLAGHDPGEPPLRGGMLLARHGRGTYVYTAYAWFRQLPAGVPGAYRIFANLLSLGRTAP